MLVRCNPLLRIAPLTAVMLALSMPSTGGGAQAQVPAGVEATAPADVFTVERVPVDVTAANAALARDQALGQAQRDALARLFDKLTLDDDNVRVPNLGAAELEQLVQSFEVVSERASPVRYVAEINVTFRPAAVRALMLANGVRYAEVQSKPVLILPVDETGAEPVLWQQATPWRRAWEDFQPPPGLLPVVVPYGELQDVTDIGVAEALAGDEQAMRRIADRYDAGAVAVARLGMQGELQTVSVQASSPSPLDGGDPSRFLAVPAPLTPIPDQPAPAGQGEPGVPIALVTIHRFQGEPEVIKLAVPSTPRAPAEETVPDAGGAERVEALAEQIGSRLPPQALAQLPATVQQVAHRMEQDWIRANLLETGRESMLSVRVPIRTLQDWMETRARLGQVPTVTRTRLVQLTREQAEVELYYLGEAARLRTALAQRDLILEEPTPPLAAQLPVTGMGGPDQHWRLQWRGAMAPGQGVSGTPVPVDLGTAPPVGERLPAGTP